MFADVFIKRPVLSTVCSLLIILAGAIAIPTLPIARYPELAPPAVSVTAFYTGANAQTVESAVTTPLEQAINGVEGMTYMTSSSHELGCLDDHRHVRRRRAIRTWPRWTSRTASTRRSAACRWTCGPTASSVSKVTAGFMGGLGFFSKDNRYTNQFISNYLDLYVRDAIKRVPGVGDVIIFGERRYAMRLWLDPSLLAARKLTAGDVLNALREQNVQVAAGALGDQPAQAGQQYTMSVRAVGRLTEVAEFENVVVQTGGDGALVRVKDVGRVELGAEQVLGEPALPRAGSVGHGHHAAAVGQRARRRISGVMEEMARLETELPARARMAARVRQRQRRPRIDHRGAEDAGRGDRAGDPRDVPVPPELAQHGHSGGHDSGVAGRHLRVHQAVRLLDQHADAVRHRARHRHRR